MISVPDGDGCADHDDPNENERREFLGPKIDRNNTRISSDNLHRDWYGKGRNEAPKEYSQYVAEGVEEMFHQVNNSEKETTGTLPRRWDVCFKAAFIERG